LVLGDLPDIEDVFRGLHRAHPDLPFPECVAKFEQEHNAKLNSIHLNHALKGYERNWMRHFPWGNVSF